MTVQHASFTDLRLQHTRLSLLPMVYCHTSYFPRSSLSCRNVGLWGNRSLAEPLLGVGGRETGSSRAIAPRGSPRQTRCSDRGAARVGVKGEAFAAPLGLLALPWKPCSGEPAGSSDAFTHGADREGYTAARYSPVAPSFAHLQPPGLLLRALAGHRDRPPPARDLGASLV